MKSTASEPGLEEFEIYLSWNYLGSSACKDYHCFNWHVTVHNIFKQNFPMIIFTCHWEVSTIEPRKIIAWKQRKLHRFLHRGKPKRRITLWRLKTKYRNIATSETKSNYWKEISNELRTDPGRFYNTFKPCLAKTKNKAGDSRINIKVNNTMVVFALGC